jgi:hypothetical protein
MISLEAALVSELLVSRGTMEQQKWGKKIPQNGAGPVSEFR